MSVRTTTKPATDWLEHAACRGLELRTFFPVSETGADVAVAVCAACPVREECLEYAIATRQPEGIWGGLTGVERHRLLRRRQKAARKERAEHAA